MSEKIKYYLDLTEEDLYVYKATVRRVVDGDTIDLFVDLGFKIAREMRVRILNLDTPEVYGVKKGSEEYEAGKEASAVAKSLLEGKDVYIRTYKDEQGKYGRYLADISVQTEDGWVNYAAYMTKHGHNENDIEVSEYKIIGPGNPHGVDEEE